MNRSPVAHEEAFLRSIQENPGEDAVRLIYADWLDDQGEGGRAELIRVQCALEGLPPRDPRRKRLRAREGKLLAEFGARWQEALGPPVDHWAIRRGLVEEVRLSAQVYLQRAEALFRTAPVVAVELTGVTREVLTPLTRSPYLVRVSSLHGQALGNAGLRQLVRSRHLGPLRGLDLGRCALNARGVQTLARESKLAPLTELRLDTSGHYGSFANRNQVGTQGAEALAASPYLGNLTVLSLGAEPEYHSGNEIGDAGAQALAGSANLARVTTLDLSCNRIGDAGSQALAASPRLGQLTDLNLCGNEITRAGVRALIDSPYLTRLRSLGLSSNPGGPAVDFGYDWDGTCVWGPLDERAARRLGARFRQKPRIY